MTEVSFAAPKTLIVSNNMIEADDLTEMLTSQGLGPVVHARGVDEAQDALAQASDSLQLLMFGLSLHVPEAQQFLKGLDTAGRSLLVIDGPVDYSDREGAGILQRPYSTDDVLSALSRLGLSR